RLSGKYQPSPNFQHFLEMNTGHQPDIGEICEDFRPGGIVIRSSRCYIAKCPVERVNVAALKPTSMPPATFFARIAAAREVVVVEPETQTIFVAPPNPLECWLFAARRTSRFQAVNRPEL